MPHTNRLIVLCLLLALSAGCGGAGDNGESGDPGAFRFVVRVDQSAAEEINLEIGFANDGQAPVPADDAVEYAWELRTRDDELRAAGNLYMRPELPPGEETHPLRWRAELEPDIYRIVWGGRGRGHTSVSFAVTQGADSLLRAKVQSAADSPEDPPFIE